MKHVKNSLLSFAVNVMCSCRIAVLISLFTVFFPGYALSGTLAVAPGAASTMLVLAMMLPAKLELLAAPPVPPGMAVDTVVRIEQVAGDDSAIIWLELPEICEATINPGLLDMDYQELKRNPNMAQATTHRTINTIATMADNYQFARVAGLLRDLNDEQQAVYNYLKKLHQQYIADNHIDLRRTREAGESMYVLGYRAAF